MIKNHNKAVEGTNALQAFVKEFGQEDVYNRIIVEEILKVLLGFKEIENIEEIEDDKNN